MTVIKRRCIGSIAYLGGLPAVLEPFCWAWGQLIQYNTEYLCAPGEYVHYDKATVSFHSFARNSLVERFLGDWLLMLDTDHVPDPDLAMRLVTVMLQADVSVVSGVYCHRTPPQSPVLYQWNDGGTGLSPIGDWDRDVKLIEVGSAGGGALLVRRSVYDRIRAELHSGPFDITPPFGEDHSFFKRCRTLGIPVYAAPTIESRHLEVRSFGLDTYMPPDGLTANRVEVGGFA
jgi:hypothetical protein